MSVLLLIFFFLYKLIVNIVNNIIHIGTIDIIIDAAIGAIRISYKSILRFINDK